MTQPNFRSLCTQLCCSLSLCLGVFALLTGSALAQQQDVNDATNPSKPLNIFNGEGLSINDLMRAAQELDSQSDPPVNTGKSLDKAVEQFNQSRQQPLKIGPTVEQGSSPSSSTASTVDPPLTPTTWPTLAPSPSPTP